MKQYAPFILFLVLLFFSCTEKNIPIVGTPAAPDAPSYLLPEDSFIMLLADCYIVEGIFNRNHYQGALDTAIYQEYKTVFDKYNLTQESFLENLNYYSFDEDEIGVILEKVSLYIDNMVIDTTSN